MISSSQAIRSLGSGPTGTPALPWPVAVVADTRRHPPPAPPCWRRRRRSRRRRRTSVHGSAAPPPPPCYCAQVLCSSLKPRTWFGLLNNVAADSVQIQHETQQGQNVNKCFLLLALKTKLKSETYIYDCKLQLMGDSCRRTTVSLNFLLLIS